MDDIPYRGKHKKGNIPRKWEKNRKKSKFVNLFVFCAPFFCSLLSSLSPLFVVTSLSKEFRRKSNTFSFNFLQSSCPIQLFLFSQKYTDSFRIHFLSSIVKVESSEIDSFRIWDIYKIRFSELSGLCYIIWSENPL